MPGSLLVAVGWLVGNFERTANGQKRTQTAKGEPFVFVASDSSTRRPIGYDGGMKDENGKELPQFVGIPRACYWLGVPDTWLRREVKEGRIPGIMCGRLYRVHLDKARDVLTDRAVRGGDDNGSAA
jgi:excisionase family DNA binding protein